MTLEENLDYKTRFDTLVKNIAFRTDSTKVLIFTTELLIQVLYELHRINERIDEIDNK